MPIDAPIGTLQTFGTIGGFTVKTIRRATVIGDFTQRKTVLAVTLTKGSTVYEAGSFEDDVFNPGPADAVARGIITAFAAIGASTSLGTGGQSPIPAGGASDGYAYRFSKAVDLVPGTPLPPCAAACVFGPANTNITLILAGGGTAIVQDVTGGGVSGGGTPVRAFTAVDAIVPANCKVQFLY